ncbi:MAG: SDR family oxidoreductase [Rhodobacterales bacterium]|jgi:NADP-dependent 3-hydroxy acid dehydrogenase YdfG|nr:SDR family oxidoreductase [Rhodobacterales bacterium]
MSAEGKSVIITGASSGIGAATAKRLAEAGAQVMLAARREDRLKQLSDEIGPNAAWRVTDVTSHNDMLSLAQAAIKHFGKVDVIVNNAGIMPLSPLANRRVDEWDRMIDVNIKGVLYGIDAVLPHMLERKDGHVINVSSVAGLMTNPTSAVYSGTKHAVKAISEGLRKETAGVIRVTTIYPGKVNTELGLSIKDPDVLAGIGDRFNYTGLEGGDIAEAIHFAIASPRNMVLNDIVIRPIEQVL